MATECLVRYTLFSGTDNGWWIADDVGSNMKTSTSGLDGARAIKLPIWGPRDLLNEHRRQQMIWLSVAVSGVLALEIFPLFSCIIFYFVFDLLLILVLFSFKEMLL